MHKKGLRIIGWMLLLCLAGSFAAAGSFSREEWYAMGISGLTEMTADASQEAADCFQAAGNYMMAQNYKQYALSLKSIFLMEDGEADIDTVLLRLQMIAGDESFSASLAENGLPSCDQLIAYMQARQYELAGDYYSARKIYVSLTGVLDAMDKQIDLVPKMYEQANRLYEQKDYRAAAEIFQVLGQMKWKDSAEKYQQVLTDHDHQWIDATCTEPKTCTRCGKTEGEPSGHIRKIESDTGSEVCSRCGEVFVTVAGEEAFYEDYSYIPLSDGTIRIVKYSGDEKKLVIPSELDGKRVTSIGRTAFSNCHFLTSVTIPGSVTCIGEKAFCVCSSLTSVTILDGVTCIGDGAFMRCSSLTSVTIPDSVTSIRLGAFAWCKSLTSVTIPDSVNSIGANPFAGCVKLTDIIVSPDHPYLAMIDGVLFSKPDQRLVCYPYAFTADSYIIPNGIHTIGMAAFRECESLISVTIPDSVTCIENAAFASCTSLTSVTIPDSVTSIGDNAFSSCDSLTATVTIGSYAENYCKENHIPYIYAN